MSLKLHTVVPPSPSTTRGQPYNLAVWPKQNSVVYGSGLFVFARNVDEPGTVKAVHRNKHPVTAVRVSPSQAYCASGDKEGNVVVWALDNEQNTVKLETKVTSEALLDICWSADSQRLVAVGQGRESFAAAFLVDTGASVGDMKGHTKMILSCDMRPERPFRVATASEDQEVNWYEGPPFKFSKGLKDHSNTVNCVRFSPNGELLVSTSSDKKILTYDGKTAERNGEFPSEHTGSIYSAAWHKSGKQLATASADKTVRLWDVESRKCVKVLKLEDSTVDYMQLGCVFLGDKVISVGYNGDVNVFDESGAATVLRGHSKAVTALAVDGQTVVTCSSEPAVLIWADQTHSPKLSKRAKAKKTHGSVVSGAVIQGDKVYTCAMDDTIACTSLATGDLSLFSQKVSGGPNGMVMMDGHLVVTTNKGIFVLTPEGEEKTKVSTTYTPSCCATNGKVLVVGAKEKKAVLYAMKGGKLEELETVPDAHKAAVTSVAWSKDGSRFATGDAGREVLLWEYAGGLKNVSGPGEMAYHTQTIKCMAFSPSGKFLATGSVDSSVFVWNLEAKTRAKVMDAHLGGINCINWLSETEVISAGMDGAIRTWTFTA
ncbi:hypothetical protein DIPPA_28810 [Diplonema papillatum]|nr:hypothetical protein DIPPA_28810 [Diplonema papillatum]